MTIHDRSYKRRMRARSIKRKKAILKHLGALPYYKHDGQYSKGKIHHTMFPWSKEYYPSFNEEKVNSIMDTREKEELYAEADN